MALDFPNSPTVGQTFFSPGGIQWQWDGGKWTAAPTVYLSTIVVSDSPPAFTNSGFWFDSGNAQLFIGYDDGSSQQWVIANNTDSTTAGVDTWNGNSGDVVMTAADVSAVMPIASTITTGGIKVDGTTVTVTGGVLSATMSSGVVSFNTRPGPAITLTSGDVTGALTFTPYNATNPSNYQTLTQLNTALLPYAFKASPTFTGTATVPSLVVGSMTAITGYAEGIGVIGNTLVARHVIAVTATTVAAIPGPPPGTTSAVITMGSTDTDLQIGNGVFDMQPFIVRIDQGSTPHAVTLGSSIAVGIDTPSFVASGSNKSDLVGFLWHASKAKWLLTSIQHGY